MIEDLPSKSMKELRAIAKELGLTVTREPAEALRTRITLHLQPGLLNELNKNGTEQGREKADKPRTVVLAQPIAWLTAQDVVEALRPFQERIKLAFYDENGNPSSANAKTWRVQNGPAEDSGSMTMPLAMIRRKAEQIATARFPAKISRSGTDMDGSLSV